MKVRGGQVCNKAFYVAIGVAREGERDILGIWAGTGGEGAKYWMNVLIEIKNRGVRDVLMVVCDGLRGFPEAIRATWENTVVQTLSVWMGGGRTVRSATCAAAVRTCANALPSRSLYRPVRPPRGGIAHQPAGVAAPVGVIAKIRS